MKPCLRLLMTADAVGGVWNYCLELVAGLRGYGVEIALAVMGERLSAKQRAEVARLENVEVFESDYRLEWMENPWDHVDAAGDWLFGIADRFRPHLVHLNGYVQAALPWHVPVVVVAHSCLCSWWRAVKKEGAPPRLKPYHKRVEEGLRAADLVVAPSFAMREALESEYAFATLTRVIPNGRAPDVFRAEEKQPFIFSAGRFWDEAKNLALLERIAPSLRWPVRLAGTDTRSEPNERSLALLGRLDQSRLAQELAVASIYAAPARYEPFGLGILEAALSGCALVLADIPSLRENWSGAAVFLSPDDDTAWREELNCLSADARRRADLSASARRRSACFSTSRMAAAYFEVYQSLSRQPNEQLMEASLA